MKDMGNVRHANHKPSSKIRHGKQGALLFYFYFDITTGIKDIQKNIYYLGQWISLISHKKAPDLFDGLYVSAFLLCSQWRHHGVATATPKSFFATPFATPKTIFIMHIYLKYIMQSRLYYNVVPPPANNRCPGCLQICCGPHWPPLE